MVPRCDCNQPITAPTRYGAHILQRPRIVEVLLEKGIGARPVRSNHPDTLNMRPAALLILPPRVPDGPVCEGMRQIITVFGNTQLSNLRPVRPARIQITRCLVLVILIALQRTAASLRNKNNITIRRISRIKVAPLAAGNLPGVSTVGGYLKNMRRLLRPPQIVICPAIFPSRRRLAALGFGISKDNPLAVPGKVHPMNMTRSQRTVKKIPNGRLAIGAVKSHNANITARPRHPRHVVETYVRIRLLGKPLDEYELVKVDRRIGKHKLAHNPPRPKIQRLCVLPRSIRSSFKLVANHLNLRLEPGHIHPALSKITRQQSPPLNRLAHRILNLSPGPCGHLCRRPLTDTALVRRPPKSHIGPGRRAIVDFNLIQMKIDRCRACDLQTNKSCCTSLCRQDYIERPRPIDPAKVFTLIVMQGRPGMSVIRYGNEQIVRIMQTRRIVQTVVNHNPGDLFLLAQIDLPPRVRLQTGMKRVLPVFNPVDRTSRISPRRNRRLPADCVHRRQHRPPGLHKPVVFHQRRTPICIAPPGQDRDRSRE